MLNWIKKNLGFGTASTVTVSSGDILVREGDRLGIYTADGSEKQQCQVTSVLSSSALTIRGLRWYERLWARLAGLFGSLRIDRRVKEMEDRAEVLTEQMRNRSHGQSHFLGVRIRQPMPGDRDYNDTDWPDEIE